MNVSVLGGTGEQGRGLAQRLARAGQSVMIGSRTAERAQSIAAEIGSGVAGGSNEDAARFGDIVIVAVPWVPQSHGVVTTALVEVVPKMLP